MPPRKHVVVTVLKYHTTKGKEAAEKPHAYFLVEELFEVPLGEV